MPMAIQEQKKIIDDLKKNIPLMPLPYPELPFTKFTLTIVIELLKLANMISETMKFGKKQERNF